MGYIWYKRIKRINVWYEEIKMKRWKSDIKKLNPVKQNKKKRKSKVKKIIKEKGKKGKKKKKMK